MGCLVWLFREHRELNNQFQTLLRVVQEKNQTIMDLEKQIRQRPGPENLQQVLENVFAEAPFADGKIPDALWLTPEDERASR